MKQALIGIVSATLSLAVLAADAKTSPEEQARKAAARQNLMAKTGGMLMKEGTGKILFVNCQDYIPSDEIKTRVDRIAFVLKYSCELTNGTWKFGDAKPSGAEIVVYVVNDDSLPMSLIAPEAGWGVVNTKNLKAGKRFSKELTRVFALTAGAGMSQVKTAPLQPAVTPADLDKLIADGFTFDMANAVITTLKFRGVTQKKMYTYKKACEEGWAPAPTNDVQKAIWDKVHAMPANPIKIKPETKKVAE